MDWDSAVDPKTEDVVVPVETGVDAAGKAADNDAVAGVDNV